MVWPPWRSCAAGSRSARRSQAPALGCVLPVRSRHPGLRAALGTAPRADLRGDLSGHRHRHRGVHGGHGGGISAGWTAGGPRARSPAGLLRSRGARGAVGRAGAPPHARRAGELRRSHTPDHPGGWRAHRHPAAALLRAAGRPGGGHGDHPPGAHAGGGTAAGAAGLWAGLALRLEHPRRHRGLRPDRFLGHLDHRGAGLGWAGGGDEPHRAGGGGHAAVAPAPGTGCAAPPPRSPSPNRGAPHTGPPPGCSCSSSRVPAPWASRCC